MITINIFKVHINMIEHMSQSGVPTYGVCSASRPPHALLEPCSTNVKGVGNMGKSICSIMPGGHIYLYR